MIRSKTDVVDIDRKQQGTKNGIGIPVVKYYYIEINICNSVDLTNILATRGVADTRACSPGIFLKNAAICCIVLKFQGKNSLKISVFIN